MQKLVIAGEATASFLRVYRIDKEKLLSPEIRELVEDTAQYTHNEMLQALDWFASVRPVVDKLAAKYSVIITPSGPDEAPLGIDGMGSPDFNALWTVSRCLEVLSASQLTRCRRFICLSSIFLFLLEKMGCQLASRSSRADVEIGICCTLRRCLLSLLWDTVVGR